MVGVKRNRFYQRFPQPDMGHFPPVEGEGRKWTRARVKACFDLYERQYAQYGMTFGEFIEFVVRDSRLGAENAIRRYGWTMPRPSRPAVIPQGTERSHAIRLTNAERAFLAHLVERRLFEAGDDERPMLETLNDRLNRRST